MGPVQPAVMCQQKLRVQAAQQGVGEKTLAAFCTHVSSAQPVHVLISPVA